MNKSSWEVGKQLGEATFDIPTRHDSKRKLLPPHIKQGSGLKTETSKTETRSFFAETNHG